MKYEVRDNETNNYLFGTFTKYEDAINCVNELIYDELEKDDFEIFQVFTDIDKNKLAYNLITTLRYRITEQDKFKLDNHCFRICDVNVIEGYSINELFIKLLIVDKCHSIMLLSYSVTTNDYLQVVDYEQIRHSYFV